MWFSNTFLTSETPVERGFSRHRAIHFKFRTNLADDLVEKILFIRENKLRDEDFHELPDDVFYVEPFDDVIDDV